MEMSATSALAHLNSEVPYDHQEQHHRSAISEMEPVVRAEPDLYILDESAQAIGQANGVAPSSQRIDTDTGRSLDTQEVVATDNEIQTVITSDVVASPVPLSSSVSESPIAQRGFDQQAFDALSHMLSRQNSFSDSQAEALSFKVIAGMPGVESLKVQQDQSGQLHLLLQLNQSSGRPAEEHKAELLAELSRRGHEMGSVSIFQPAGSALAEQDI